MGKRAQSWGLDLMIGMTIFSLGIFSFYIYSLNYSSEGEEALRWMLYDGNMISNVILSEGYPADWNSSSVVKIGILSEGKINETKLERFYSLALENYSETKPLFNTKYDYFFFLDENFTIGSSQVNGIGKPSTNPASITSNNLVKITRFTIYKNKPVTAYIYVWEGY
jgi:hypothetical protein